jgi:two-component system, chemotaxis family, sensor kinase Cph1
MGTSDPNQTRGAIEGLREALAAETRARLELQGRLDSAGAEFEEFVSIAAHNLRDSLRDVASFSQLMAETYAGRLDPDAGVFLKNIQEGAARAQSLLGEMVDYWAADTVELQLSPTDMEAVLRQALLKLGRQVAERGAVVTHDPLPQVRGDFELLTKALHPLIRNAIQYCEAPAPQVHISSRRVDGGWEISVQDNGPGIDPAFHSRIFRAFQRLHGKDHPGNGLGLAFCKKAIERLGGRIRLESTPGTGSTFYFTLPPAD